MSAPPTTATNLIVDDIEIVETEGCAIVNIRFNFPVRYMRHFPYNSGEDLRIQLESIVSSAEESAALRTRERVALAPGEAASLSEVLFEGNIDGGPFLSLFFTRPVGFKVKQGSDFRSLVISVSDDGGPPCPITE
jgi:hypothetical protein